MKFDRSELRVWIWDSNSFNPYGAEIARVIGDSMPSVLRIGRQSREPPSPPSHYRNWRLLPTASGGHPSMATRARYVTALMTFAVGALIIRPRIVIPWISNTPEAVVIAILQVLGLRTFVVVHNPVASRDEASRSFWHRRIRLRATCLVVHTSGLAEGLLDYKRVEVAAHPAYFEWMKERQSRSSTSSQRPPRSSTASIYRFAADG